MSIPIKNLKTGDILLFSSTFSWTNPMTWAGGFVEFFTKKPYSHVGMILKDPTWIKPEMTGIYLWESSYEGIPDPQDDKIKLGVMITPIKQVLSQSNEKIWVRQLFDAENKLTIPVLEKIHKIVYEKPYDFNPIDWLSAYLRKNFEKRKDSRFFCSALVACIYAESGIIDPNTNWTIVRPSDFDETDSHLTWNGESHLEGLFEIL
jgi:hypothetical protein